MTRTETRALWIAALTHFGSQPLEQKVLIYLEALLDELGEERPYQVSAEGLAQLVGILLSDIEAGERPMFETLRAMNRQHVHVLRQLRGRLALSLLADLPAGAIPKESRALKLELNLGL